ncbi:sigma factor, partial [Acinetobacter baumannii]|nr:sigma factor [Acinetobacter baumannii]
MISKNQDDAEDIMQSVFTKIYKLEKSKNPINNYSSLLYSITKNETINYLKKKKNDIPLDKVYEIPNDNNELNKIVDNIEFNKLISKL